MFAVGTKQICKNMLSDHTCPTELDPPSSSNPFWLCTVSPCPHLTVLDQLRASGHVYFHSLLPSHSDSCLAPCPGLRDKDLTLYLHSKFFINQPPSTCPAPLSIPAAQGAASLPLTLPVPLWSPESNLVLPSHHHAVSFGACRTLCGPAA